MHHTSSEFISFNHYAEASILAKHRFAREHPQAIDCGTTVFEKNDYRDDKQRQFSEDEDDYDEALWNEEDTLEDAAMIAEAMGN